MTRYLIIGLLLAVGACAGTAETRATNALAIACDSFATGLDQITPIRKAGKVSPDNVNRVDAAIRLVTPVCSSNAVVDPDTAIGVVREGIDLLKNVKSAL
jgi:hypothetical protein